MIISRVYAFMLEPEHLSDTELIDQGDKKLDVLSTSLKQVKQVSFKLHEEILSHEPIMGDLERTVDKTSNNLNNKRRKLDDVINKQKEYCSMWVYFTIIGFQVLTILAIIGSWFK